MAFMTSSVTFSGEEIRSLADVFIASLFEKPELTAIHTIDDNIVAAKQIGLVTRLSKITKKDAGCGTGVTNKSVALSNKSWAPVQTKIWQQLCASEFNTNFMIYLKNKGINYADVTNTDIAGFVLDMMTDAAVEDLWRIAWFNMTTPANLTSGTDVSDYNLIEGLWNQIYTIVSGDSTRNTTTGGLTTANGQATFALQDSTFTAANAKDTLANLLTDADYRLQSAPDKVIVCTQSVFNKYCDYLESIAVPLSFEKIEGGFTALKRRGVDIIPVNFWDRTIRADFSNGTKYYLPHRALLSTKRNLRIGLDDPMAYTEFDVFFDKMTETNNFKGGYRVDAKVVEDYMIQVAY